MFEGFTNSTYEFFMALSFNNNTDFFHANHDWYLKALRLPFKELHEELSGAIELFDPLIDRKFSRVISHINRDLRGRPNITPYKEDMWLSYRRNSSIAVPEIFVDVSAKGVLYGMSIGNWSGNIKGIAAALRHIITEAPDEFRELIKPLQTQYTQEVYAYKRLKLPDDIPDDLKPYCMLRSGMSFLRNVDPDTAASHELVNEIVRALDDFKPLYDFLSTLDPIDE